MHIDWAKPLLSMYPKAASYDGQTIILVGEYPAGFEGEEVRIFDMELTNVELVKIVDDLRAESPHTGKLVIISEAQGKYLHENHEVFKVTDVEI